jgi:hypothetical protein
MLAKIVVLLLAGLVLISPNSAVGFLISKAALAIMAVCLLVTLFVDPSLFVVCLVCIIAILTKTGAMNIRLGSMEGFHLIPTAPKICKPPAPAPPATITQDVPVHDHEYVMPMGTERERGLFGGSRRPKRRADSDYYSDTYSVEGSYASSFCSECSSSDGYESYDGDFEDSCRVEHFADDGEPPATPMTSTTLNASAFSKLESPFKTLNAFVLDQKQKDSNQASLMMEHPLFKNTP